MRNFATIALTTLLCGSVFGCGGGSGDGGTTSGGTPGGTTSNCTGAICAPPISLYDTSHPTAVIGTGTPASCSGADVQTAAERGGIITFNCGPSPVTLVLTATIVLPVNVDTIIDGGGLITLDAQSQMRHFMFSDPNFMSNSTKIVLQRIKLINGSAPLGAYFPQDPANPKCSYGYKDGAGGAIYVRNGVLQIIDSEFDDNVAALLGPDVAGGAVYALGSLQVIITGSVFRGNRAANGGAVGMLFANPQIYNTVFENNTAEGVGQNYSLAGCPTFNGAQQAGAGGNGGAIVFDGLNDVDKVYTISLSAFRNNRGNELGGALFRTPNTDVREMVIGQSIFDGNTARQGGVSFIMQNNVTVGGSTFMNNRSGVDINGNAIAGSLGGLWIYQGSIALENSTFSNNQPTGLDVENGAGAARNVTFVNSLATGVSVDNSLFVNTSCSATLTGSNDLQWPQGSPCVGTIGFADPKIGALGDNGGPTPTFLPAAGGPVENVGVNCSPTDQRGIARNTARCAAGAVEP